MDQLSIEDHLHTNRSAVDKHKLVRPALDTNTFDEEKRRERQEEDGELGMTIARDSYSMV